MARQAASIIRNYLFIDTRGVYSTVCRICSDRKRLAIYECWELPSRRHDRRGKILVVFGDGCRADWEVFVYTPVLTERIGGIYILYPCIYTYWYVRLTVQRDTWSIVVFTARTLYISKLTTESKSSWMISIFFVGSGIMLFVNTSFKSRKSTILRCVLLFKLNFVLLISVLFYILTQSGTYKEVNVVDVLLFNLKYKFYLYLSI